MQRAGNPAANLNPAAHLPEAVGAVRDDAPVPRATGHKPTVRPPPPCGIT